MYLKLENRNMFRLFENWEDRTEDKESSVILVPTKFFGLSVENFNDHRCDKR